jgi:hypothetical protein
VGTSTSWAQVGRKLEALGDGLGDNKPALHKTGMAGKVSFARHASHAGVLGKRVAGKRKAITVAYDLLDGHGNGVMILYRGPAHLVNNPTKPHRIEPRRPRGSRSRRRGRQALTIGGNLRAGADHPGTRGKGFYQRARAECVKTLPGVYGRASITSTLQKVIG